MSIPRKTKICAGCGKDKIIWKNINGKPLCQNCAYKLSPSKKKVASKTTTSRISAASEKRIIKDKQYVKLRKEFLKENHTCACGGVIPGCTGDDPQYLTIQHTRGRIGSLYLDTRYWITLSLNCHMWVNEHPKEALEMGLAESRLKKD